MLCLFPAVVGIRHLQEGIRGRHGGYRFGLRENGRAGKGDGQRQQRRVRRILERGDVLPVHPGRAEADEVAE
jgi:hypothetical protein